MTPSETSNESLRRAIIEALPPETSLHGEAPEKRHVYVPPSHVKALRLANSLVIGGRGVGKTFWSAALRSEDVREWLVGKIPELSDVEVATGYGEKTEIDFYPDASTFSSLLDASLEPYDVWRAVVVRRLDTRRSIPQSSWKESSRWVAENPETVARILQDAENSRSPSNTSTLFVFDALDRSARQWETMDRIIRGLLRVLLDLKPFRNLHGKVFLREDQFHNRNVAEFPDASKLTATRVELTWGLEDLHGLLWQYLGNASEPEGETMRDFADRAGAVFGKESGVRVPGETMKRDRVLQKRLFSALAGQWMGRDHRRGGTYTWIVGHLADARGMASPRSFLAAVRAAAEDSLERYPNFDFPLHYESIKRGVQEASRIRVKELAEDYPWLPGLMEPLAGLVVPCGPEEFENRWLKRFSSPDSGNLFGERLPPEHLAEGWSGIREDLARLGIFETMRDGRLNMPDLYRVGFGLGRRGGVRPVGKKVNYED